MLPCASSSSCIASPWTLSLPTTSPSPSSKSSCCAICSCCCCCTSSSMRSLASSLRPPPPAAFEPPPPRRPSFSRSASPFTLEGGLLSSAPLDFAPLSACSGDRSTCRNRDSTRPRMLDTKVLRDLSSASSMRNRDRCRSTTVMVSFRSSRSAFTLRRRSPSCCRRRARSSFAFLSPSNCCHLVTSVSAAPTLDVTSAFTAWKGSDSAAMSGTHSSW
mmetsp:Transcript_27973/g.63292  ORF Transcript_27973/g.63292 Transcript_27973/m.63292 type:complete len:217 (+) Transcript_27973:716-1366(+)